MIETLYFSIKIILLILVKFLKNILELGNIIFSTMSYKLYSPKHQATAGQRIELFARFIDIPITFERIAFDQIKSPEYLAKHPLGKVPLL